MGINKEQTVHRPSALKQTNKIHKHGKHRSKGAVEALTKGKVSVKSMTVHQKKKLNKDARKHQAEQIRRNKRNEILLKKRCLGDTLFPPYLVCLLPLNGNIDSESAISMLCTCDEEAVVNKSDTNVTHIYLPRFKQRFSFYVPQKDNNLFILDALKVCDTVLFITTAAFGVENDSNIIDEWGSSILTAALAQSLPTTCLAVMDIESVHPKKQNETKQIIQKHVSKWIPEEKLMCLGKSTEALNILRKIGNQKQKSILYRDRRSHLFAESYSYEDNVTDGMGTLKISGFLRGSPLSVNGLVHLPGLGDFQMSRIDAPNDPFIQKKKWKNENQMDANESVTVRILEKCDASKQESLVSENIPDAMDAEQTWPTPEELKEAEENVTKKVVKKIPKGWSSYQAAWIPDIDGEIIESDSESEENMSFSDALSEDKSSCSDNDDDFKSVITESEINESDEKYDQGIDLKEENEVLRKMKDAKNDMLFPDEVDTPQDVSARERFQRYRGLESFRTSPWDPKENLPSDYARIFQFENFDRTRKRILKEKEDNDGALPGWYITVHVTGVSKHLWESFVKTKAPLILFGLLPHEHKMSVLNVVLKRTNMYNLPIKAKERLIFQCGYRRFIVNPIFSHHTNGNKHKYERFFQPNTAIVATFYAPIQFPPSPVLCYKQTNDDVVLVATGNLLSVNPDRLIIKRTVLSGHPFKVHKRSAVIRFMFFNREDIQYFKPCKLRTKYGRIGHIKEPLGTHGHMKCVFDGQLKSQDTVLLNLYKRVFPKWTYEDCIVSCQDEEIETMQE